MNITKKMLRKTAAFIAAISFLTVSNYDTASVIAAEIIENQLKTADVNNNGDYSNVFSVDEKAVTNELINYLNSLQNKPQDCHFSDDNGNIKVSYKATEETKGAVYNEIKNFMSGIIFEKAIGNIYYVCRVNIEKSFVNSEKYYKLDIDSNSPIESVIIGEENIKQTDDGSKYIKDGTELTNESFNIKKGYYLECLNVENKTTVKAPIYIDNETVVYRESNEKIVAIFDIKKTRYRINFSVDFKIIIKLYREGKTSYVLNSIEGNWVDIESDRIDFSFGKGILMNGKPLSSNGEAISWYHQCSIKELLENANANIEYSSNGEVIDIDITNMPDTVESDITYRNGVHNIFDVTDYFIENNKVKIPLIVKRYETEYYLSRINYNNNQFKEYTEEEVFNKLQEDFYSRDIDYYNGIKLNTIYKKFEESENKIDKETIIKSAAANGGRRNDDFIIIDNNAELKLGAEFEGKYFYVVHNDEPEFAAVKNGVLDLKDVEDEDVIEIKGVFDIKYNENNEIVSISTSKLKEYIGLYADKKSPDITIDENDIRLTYPNNGWSNSTNEKGYGVFKFRFNVVDNVSDRTAKEYEKVKDNPDINSISQISIGGLIFDKPAGGWSSEESISPIFNVGMNYNIVLIPLETYGDFEAVVTLKNSTIKGIDEDMTISATDYNSNTSSKVVKVRIDTYTPKITDILVDDICEGLDQRKFIEHGKNLNITMFYSDTYQSGMAKSGVASINVKYGDKEEEIKNINPSTSIISFDVRNISEYSGKIQITITDKAGNEETFYYCERNKVFVTKDPSKAAVINIDNKPTAEPEIIVKDADFTEGDFLKKYFYKKYPEFYFKTESEIKTLDFNINGKNINVDIYDKLSDYETSYISAALESGKMYVEFVTDSSDITKFIPHIRYAEDEAVDILLSYEYICLDDEKLAVSLNTFDFAGNTNSEHTEKSYREIYIDNDAPEIIGTYTIDDAYKSNVNITSFGVFANKKIAIRVPFSEGSHTSGINPKNAVIEFAGKKYYAESIIGNEAVFVIPDVEVENDVLFMADGTLEMMITDNVGNTSEKVVLHAENNIEGILFEHIKPIISETEITGENMFINGAGEKWFSSDVSVSYDISDEQSGLSRTIFNKYNVYNNSEYKTENSFINEKVISDSYFSNTDYEKDGKFIFTVEAFDNANNYEKQETIVYKDNHAPYISGFNFNWQTVEEQKKYESFNITSNMSDRFSHFFEADTTMTIFARDDRGASSGIKSISYVLYNTDGSVFRNGEVTNVAFDELNNVYSCQVVIPEGFKGDIKAWAVDNVKNISEEKSPDGYASENGERHKLTSNVIVNIPQTENTDTNGLPLYKSDITADIKIIDSFSGIRRVEWITSDFEGWRVIEVDANGYIYGDIDGWNVDSRERNIATSVSRNLTVTKDANNDFIRLRVFDNAGNFTEIEKVFSIDKKSPVVKVEGIEPNQEKKYFNNNRKATVTISERNFNAPIINGQADTEFKLDENSRIGTDEQKYTKTFTYDKDGVYSLDIESTDRAGNSTDKFSVGEFVIDKTNPVLSVEFVKANGSVVNPLVTKYIDSSVRAVISVNEVNFDSSKIMINGKPSEGTWRTVGNVHTLEIPYSADKEYTLTVSGKDLAENPMNEYTATFVIDNAKPEIDTKNFTEANKGDVDISLSIKDGNIDTYEAILYRNNKICDCSYDSADDSYKFKVAPNKYIVGRWTVLSSGNMEFVFDNFPNDESFDGMYQLKVNVSDKSVNKQSLEKTFSVNRFGSVFEVLDYEAINGNYLNYAPEIIIKERNIDKHKDGTKPVVMINKGTQIVELTEDMYTLSKPELLSDKSGYEYTYTIDSSNFTENVRYQIAIKSVDKAGNENVSEKRGADIEFNVDTRKPEPICDELDDNEDKTFKGAEKEFTINVNEPLKNIKIMIDSQNEPLLEREFDMDSEAKAHRFIVNASDNKRNITVELVDFAGNKTTKEYRGVRVTENMFIIMLSKAWVKIAGMVAVGVAALSALGIIFIKKKKQ